ncbi:MAG: methyltransferase domain-containing protein [Desulfuromonadales bacterium]|nr:methyltransferase domain-containing protein [Desulfuromonadales bacterium]
MKTSDWTVPELLQLSGDYWATCALHAGVVLDIFTPLDGTVRSVEEVSSICGSDRRATEMLLNALCALGLVEKHDGYKTTGFSSRYLVRSSPDYLGHIIRHHHHLMGGWAMLHESVKSGNPVTESVSHEDSVQIRESFLMGMFNLASQMAPMVVGAVNLSGRQRLLDLGGGPGSYAIHFCRHNPGLTAVVYDLPTTRTFAETTIARFGLSDRIGFVAGDFLSDRLPDGFDAAWLSHVLHSSGTEECGTILGKATGALQPGGTLLVQEFILNDGKDGPLFPALFSLNMLLRTDGGQSYSESELRIMMHEAGLIDVHRLAVQLPNGAGIMAGTRP